MDIFSNKLTKTEETLTGSPKHTRFFGILRKMFDPCDHYPK